MIWIGKEILYLKTKLFIIEEEKNNKTIKNHLCKGTLRGFNLTLYLEKIKFDVLLDSQ